MVAQPGRSLMSVQDYLALDRVSEARYEFIDGYVYMLAGGTLNHSRICVNMIRELSLLLRGSSCSVYTSDARVRLSNLRYVYPDISITCDSRDQGEDDIIHYPCVIIEVLSPRTEAYDRGDKFGYYRTCASIQEYILINTRRQAVEVYRREQGFWKLYEFGPDEQMTLESLNIRIPLASIYEHVTFSEEA